jgi:hypothetical protein
MLLGPRRPFPDEQILHERLPRPPRKEPPPRNFVERAPGVVHDPWPPLALELEPRGRRGIPADTTWHRSEQPLARGPSGCIAPFPKNHATEDGKYGVHVRLVRHRGRAPRAAVLQACQGRHALRGRRAALPLRQERAGAHAAGVDATASQP